jgi:TonB family protein
LHSDVADRPRIEFKLDVAETLKESPDSIVVPPSNALPVDLNSVLFKLDSVQNFPTLLKKAGSEYPQNAKERGIQGTVVIQATIGKDGHASNPRVASGPRELQQAALDAVNQWFYVPFRVMDEPRAVDIEINLIFTLG